MICKLLQLALIAKALEFLVNTDILFGRDVLASCFVEFSKPGRQMIGNFPPGPPSLPLVGCTPFLKTREGGRNLMLSVDLIPKYGNIIGYDFGPMK